MDPIDYNGNGARFANCASDSSKGARATPRLVTIAVMSGAGVTSKAGLRTLTPVAAPARVAAPRGALVADRRAGRR